MKTKIGWIAVWILCLTLALFGCSASAAPVKIAEDEIALRIQLDVKEDIGLLIVNYETDTASGSGGTSNANKSLLKHDELIDYTLSKHDFNNSPDAKNLTLEFAIVTEYVDPNYENIYPEELTKTLNAIHLDAAFGQAYAITITGDRTNGYTAVLG